MQFMISKEQAPDVSMNELKSQWESLKSSDDARQRLIEVGIATE